MQKGEKTFIEDLVNSFPEIREEVLDGDYAGLLVLQVACFTRFTQQAINTGDLATIDRCFGFFSKNFGNVIFKVENSLVISYLEKLDFSNNSNAEKRFSAKLQMVLKELKRQRQM